MSSTTNELHKSFGFKLHEFELPAMVTPMYMPHHTMHMLSKT